MDRPVKRVVSAEIQRGGRWLITQRSSHAVLPLLWEFPGGRVREGEQEEAALIRSLQARIGVEIEVIERLLEVRHDYEDYSVLLAVWRCSLGDQEPYAASVAGIAWVDPQDLADYPFPGADQRTVELLLHADV